MIEIELEKFFKNKRIVVTGGLGSIGSVIVQKLLKYEIKEIIIIDNRETELFYAESMYNVNESKNGKITYKFVDIREREKLNSIFKNIDIVFHAAAMKHVIVCEENPFEAVKTNVYGTENIISSCINNNVEKMILISTDKTVNPSNVMGATKLVAEKLINSISLMKNNEIKTKFGIVRFGNVLNSRGSVLEIWSKQLKKGEQITITDKKMTRFFMSIPQSVNLIFQAAYYANNGETFILKMPSVKIIDLAKVFLKYNNKPENYLKEIGIRKGEKLNEELLLENNEDIILENEKLFVKFSIFINEEEIINIKSKGFKETTINTFVSNDNKFQLKEFEIEKILFEEFKE